MHNSSTVKRLSIMHCGIVYHEANTYKIYFYWESMWPGFIKFKVYLLENEKYTYFYHNPQTPSELCNNYWV